jgi:HPt (histidine-containing phosphotransfer) domain-containing protein
MVGAREKVLAAGMNDHIAKPIDVAEMFATLARWVRRDPPATGGGLPGIESAGALATMDGDEQLYRRLLAMFRDQEARFAERFRAARQARDLREATRLAHDLKCESGTLGATAVSEAAWKLEQSCSSGAGSADIDALLEALLEQLDPVMDGLRALGDGSPRAAAVP